MLGEAEAWAGGAETVEPWGSEAVGSEAEVEVGVAVVGGPLQDPVAGSCKELQGNPWGLCVVAEAGGAFVWAAGPYEGASEDGPVGEHHPEGEGEFGAVVAGHWGPWEAGWALKLAAFEPGDPLAIASVGMWAGEGVDEASGPDEQGGVGAGCQAAFGGEMEVTTALTLAALAHGLQGVWAETLGATANLGVVFLAGIRVASAYEAPEAFVERAGAFGDAESVASGG